jgi:hypothetical protein
VTIVKTAEGWCVVDEQGVAIAGPFATNSEAWRAQDRMERQPVSPQEKRTDFMWQQNVESRRLL